MKSFFSSKKSIYFILFSLTFIFFFTNKFYNCNTKCFGSYSATLISVAKTIYIYYEHKIFIEYIGKYTHEKILHYRCIIHIDHLEQHYHSGTTYQSVFVFRPLNGDDCLHNYNLHY